MAKIRFIFFATLALALMALPVLAQIPGGGGNAGDNANTIAAYKAIGGGILFGVAAGLGALGQGRLASAALEGSARNPSALGRLQTMMILGLAFIESLVIFALVLMFVLYR